MRTLVGLALGTLLSLGMMSAASAASNVAPPVGEQAIEEIVVTAKRVAPEVMDEVVITAKRPAKIDKVRTPPVMAIELPRLEFAVAAPPLVRL